MLALRDIDKERERLHKSAAKWGLRDQRTIRQREKVDRMICNFMTAETVKTH